MQVKKNVAILLVLLFVVMVGCGSSDVTDQIANVAQAEDPRVLGVKNGHPNNYPNISYDAAFGEFFGSPTWKYFVGTKEGPDEDEDGKPDYLKENVDIVEFTGYCMYMDVEVKALIQFTLNDDDTFDATYLSFNEVPQNLFTLGVLINTAFDSYEEKHGSHSESYVEKSQTVENLEKLEPSTSASTENNSESQKSQGIAGGDYMKYKDWCGFYEKGWMDTVIDFQLYDSPKQNGECGYITANFRGNEDKGSLVYIGNDTFEWYIYSTVYHVRPDMTQMGGMILTIYDDKDIYDCTFYDSATIGDYSYEESSDVYVIVAAPDGYVNFRTGPGTNYEIVMPIYNGEELWVVGEEPGTNWIQVKYLGNEGYITGWVNKTQVQY